MSWMTSRVAQGLLPLAGAVAIAAAQGALLFTASEASISFGTRKNQPGTLQISLQSPQTVSSLMYGSATPLNLPLPPAPPAAAAPAVLALNEGDAGRIHYLPAVMLTERPLAISDIDEELSARFAFIHPQSLAFTLLISEYGDVDQVLVPEIPAPERMPAVLLDDLIQRFSSLRFLPGRLHGQPVPSALRIRVELGD